MSVTDNNVLTLKTSNEEVKHIRLALGIDLGTCRFATIATTEGNIEILGSETLNNYCKLIEAGQSAVSTMQVWLLKTVSDMVNKWHKMGVEAVYVGCCKGDYLMLCGGDENHPFYKFKIFQTFVVFLEKYCRKLNIRIQTVDFDESYTSRANSLSSDFVPNHGDSNIPRFLGKRNLGLFVIDKHMVMNADVNAAINILHKAGYDVTIGVDSNLLEHITIVENALQGVGA